MSNWTVNEIRELLVITAERTINIHITGTVKDGGLYEKVAEELLRRGFNRNKNQVINKMKNLRKKFNEVSDHNNRSGRGRMDWEHLKVCQAIWGSKHTANPQNVQGSLDSTLVDCPTSNTPETADEERDDDFEIISESQPEQVPPPTKKRKTSTKAQDVVEGIKELLGNMDRQDAEREQVWLQEEEKRWDEAKAMREADRRARAEQFSSLSSLFTDMYQEMQNEFALLQKTIGRMTTAVPQHSTPHHHHPPVSHYSYCLPPSLHSFDGDSRSPPYLQQLD